MFGCKELVKRLMKGVFEKKPALPRYKNTWDVNIVLKELETWIPTEKLTLKELTYSLLFALLSGQRCLTIQALQITPDAMQLTDSKCTFRVNSLLKHSRRGTHQAPIELYSGVRVLHKWRIPEPNAQAEGRLSKSVCNTPCTTHSGRYWYHFSVAERDTGTSWRGH